MSNPKPAKPQPRTSAERRSSLRPRRKAGPAEDVARSLEQLRRSILGPDRERIEHLETRPRIAADTVGAVLPEAVVEATSKREHELAIALEPTVTDAVRSVAKRRPELIAEALAPTIGAAVKKAVSDAMAVIMERVNVALERSLTLRSIQWRIEAARTGRPFAEIAVSRTLVYRVEQVLLIHAPTSLVLQHVVDPVVQAPASDEVAAMMAAIESFAREAFGPIPPQEHLDRFKLGELTVWVSHDPSLTLAAVVRGTPSATLTEQLDDALARVRVRCAADLRQFAGEVAGFDVARPMLEPLLKKERQKPPQRAQVILAVVGIALGAALAACISWIVARDVTNARSQTAYLNALRPEPGIVVSSVRWKGGHASFSGFRDPLAASPEAVLARRGLAPASFDLEPFVSLDPRIVARRAEQALQPPAGVQLRIEGQTLRLAGTAPRAWADEARLLGRALPGVEHVDDAALRSRESLDALRAAAAPLESLAVTFRRGQSGIGPEQQAALRRVSVDARAAFRAAAGARIGACLVMTGHADATGTDERNRALTVERASAVGEQLASMGIGADSLRVVGAGTSLQGPLARSVTFHLDVDRARFRPGCGGAP